MIRISALSRFSHSLCIISVVAIALIMLTAGSALAVLRIGPIPDNPEYFLSSTSDPKARCRTSSLTQDKFLEMVHAIVEHHDMTDKEFIEKTLGVKFSSMNIVSIYSYIPGGGFYKANIPSDMSDAPVTVWLNIEAVSLNKASKSELSSGILFTDLSRVGAIFHDCQYLTRKQLDPMSEAVVHHHDMGVDTELNRNAPRRIKEYSLDASWNLGKVAKDGSNIQITYTFKTDDSDAIESIEIIQKSETHLKPIGEDNVGHQ